MNWVYSEKVKDHFQNPRNILENEETYNEDGRGYTGNAACGDMMLVVIKVDKEKETITDCKWKTFGCASAVASTSLLSEMVKGMTLDEAFNIKPQDIDKNLGGLPEHKIHCSVLGDKALREAINDYYKRSGQEDKVIKEEAKEVCACLNITDLDIKDAVLEGVRDFETLQEHTKIATVCGNCKSDAVRLMNMYIDEIKNRESQ